MQNNNENELQNAISFKSVYTSKLFSLYLNPNSITRTLFETAMYFTFCDEDQGDQKYIQSKTTYP